MPQATLRARVERVEVVVDSLRTLPEQVARLERVVVSGDTALREQISAVDTALREQISAVDTALREEIKAGDAALRTEMHVGFAALREEIKAGDAALRAEIKASDNAVRSDMSAMEIRLAAIIVDGDNATRHQLMDAINDARREARVLFEDLKTTLKTLRDG